MSAIVNAPSAWAESFVALRDPGYGLVQGVEQASPVPRSIRQIAYPVLGMPALVRPGESFSVLLRADCEPDLAAVEAALVLVGAPARRHALAVQGLTPDHPAQGSLRLQLRAPTSLASDHYDLELHDGACLDDRQRSAVRVHRADDGFRFAVLADEQLGDPTGHLPGGEPNGSLYPSRGLVDLAERRRGQLRAELEFLDPLFVLYPGDLVFGMDLPAEYAAMTERLGSTRLAVYAVPGNHDAYATHRVFMKSGWHRRVPRAALCVRSFSPGSPVESLGAVGGCVLGRMEEVVDYRLETDGLLGFQAALGPDSYAFAVGGVRFVGLDTYGGSAARRMAVPFSLGRLRDWIELDLLSDAGLDPLLGAPLVDNYGGFLPPADLAWLDAQILDAQGQDEALVVFGHHDPTGLYLDERGVVPNESFGNDPVGLGAFEVWNYDGAWDSDPQDGLGRESADAHSGQRLLDSLANAEATYVCGHAHYDADHQAAGDRVTVVQATTGGASLAHDGAYRGYRLVEVEDGQVAASTFAPARGWPSVPTGNLWIQELPRPEGPPDRELFTGLPVSVRGRLRFLLPDHPQGYRFFLAVDDQPEQALSLAEVGHHAEGPAAYVEVPLPAAPVSGIVAQEPEELLRARVRWEVASDNEAPEARIGLVGRRAREDRPLRALVDRPIPLSAAASADDGTLLSARWSLGGMELEGFEPRPVLHRPGIYELRLLVVDAHGAVGEAQAKLKLRRAWWKRHRHDDEPGY